MHYLFKLAVKNVFLKPKSIQYKYGDVQTLDKTGDKDETLLESLYMVRINSDEIINENDKKKDGRKHT